MNAVFRVLMSLLILTLRIQFCHYSLGISHRTRSLLQPEHQNLERIERACCKRKYSSYYSPCFRRAISWVSALSFKTLISTFSYVIHLFLQTSVARLIRRCWDSDQNVRPDFPEVKTFILHLIFHKTVSIHINTCQTDCT